MKETISIIIPAYNVQDCLGATLDSVLAQTYGSLEVIVVDDGSTDGTAKIIDAYAARDSRVKAVHKENGGVTSARLRGLSEATGAYIGFVDGDDLIEPQMYERLYENIVDEELGVYNEDGSLNLNPNSLTVLENCYVEPALAEAKAYDSFQFVRNGFFCADYKDSREGAPVFNRIVSLKSSFKLPKPE